MITPLSGFKTTICSGVCVHYYTIRGVLTIGVHHNLWWLLAGGGVQTTMARPYQQRERRLIKEFLAQHAPGITPIYNARIGPLPLGFAERINPDGSFMEISPSQRYADAALEFPDRVELWEGKVAMDGQAIGQLLVYRRAFALTPEFQRVSRLPVSLHIVAGYADPIAMEEAAAQGIEVKLYTPQWLRDMVASWAMKVSRPLVGAHATESGK